MPTMKIHVRLSNIIEVSKQAIGVYGYCKLDEGGLSELLILSHLCRDSIGRRLDNVNTYHAFQYALNHVERDELDEIKHLYNCTVRKYESMQSRVRIVSVLVDPWDKTATINLEINDESNK